VKVVGDVEYLINRTANGWVVTLLNNNGVFKTQQGMAQVDRSAYVTASITMPGLRSANEWTTNTTLKPTNNTLSIQIAPGGLAVVEIR
jgi:hypothetical protein